MTREAESGEARAERGRAAALITCDMLNAMLAPVQAGAVGEAPSDIRLFGLAHLPQLLARGEWL
jgi:hypothetical protein